MLFNSLSSWVLCFFFPSEGSITYLCGAIKPQTIPGIPRSDVPESKIDQCSPPLEPGVQFLGF